MYVVTSWLSSVSRNVGVPQLGHWLGLHWSSITGTASHRSVGVSSQRLLVTVSLLFTRSLVVLGTRQVLFSILSLATVVGERPVGVVHLHLLLFQCSNSFVVLGLGLLESGLEFVLLLDGLLVLLFSTGPNNPPTQRPRYLGCTTSGCTSHHLHPTPSMDTSTRQPL